MTSNPYQPPQASALANGDSSFQATGALVLPFAPWRLYEVAQQCSPGAAGAYGFIALSFQLALLGAITLSSIGEPYADVQACAYEVIRPLWLTSAFAIALSFVLTQLLRTLPQTLAITLLLSFWSGIVLYLPWSVCSFCNLIDAPGYGIINDDRPAWMTNAVVLAYGSLLGWLATMGLILSVAFAKGGRSGRFSGE